MFVLMEIFQIYSSYEIGLSLGLQLWYTK